MPRNSILKFGRRKSSGNAFEDIPPPPPPPAAPGASSFRVLERPEKINLNGDARPTSGPKPVTRPFNSPLANLRGKSTEELGTTLNRAADGPGTNLRGSGGTTNSGSSGYYYSSSASARHSSTSTLPSSFDAEKEPEEDELFSSKPKPSPPQPGSFTARAARALSLGAQQNGSHPRIDDVPLPPLPPNGVSRSPERSRSPLRERALTTSSYASTAKPEVNLNLGTTDFGGDFGNMFERPKSNDRSDEPLPPVPPVTTFHRTDSEPMFPPRTLSRDAYRTSPDPSRDGANSPYAWDRRGSQELLMSTSPLASPTLDGPPLPPPHRNVIAPAFLGQSREGYALVPERYPSPGPPSPGLPESPREAQHGFLGDDSGRDGGYEHRTNQLSSNPWGHKIDLHDPPASRSVVKKTSNTSLPTVQTRTPSGFPSQASAGAPRPPTRSPAESYSNGPGWRPESRNTTPKAGRVQAAQQDDESLFDSSPVGPASVAIRPNHVREDSNTPKKMTKAQFERLQRRGDASAEQSEAEEEEQAELDEYDAEDDSARAKQMARQRQKQEANMSVYRQQMKKVTGGGPTDLPSMARPSLDRAPNSAPAGGIHFGGMGGKPPADSLRGKQSDDDDEDVPLGILQAHGFPGGSRPPTRSGDNDAASRRMSAAGSVAGGAGPGNLPAFARRLPVDPFFGSSVVNQPTREPLGFNGAPSVMGSVQNMPQMMPQPPAPQMGHPAGLVGVIAGEERAKAARRGSPNPQTGTYGVPQPPMPPGIPQMQAAPGMMPGRAMSMGNMMPPQVYMPNGAPGNPMMGMQMMGQQMPMMQNPQQDQMQQFMQMQMQVMQNMIQMQHQMSGQPPAPQQQQPTPDYLGVPSHMKRPSVASVRSQAPSLANQGRSMTMTNMPTQWNDVPLPGPRPNSAMPQTYAPTGLNISNGGLGNGYTPSIAPSERSTVGQPSRYRQIALSNDVSGGRTNSMSSQLTLQPNGSRNVSNESTVAKAPGPKSTLRVIDKPKGAPRFAARAPAADEDEEEGWAEMRKKRDERKSFRFGRKDKDKDKGKEVSMEELYQNLN